MKTFRRLGTLTAGLFIGLGLGLPALAAPGQDGADVADVDAVVATVEAKRAGDARRVGMPDDLYAGEELVTGKGARLHATLTDGGKLMLGEEAVVALDRFLLEADEPAGAVRVTKGAFRMISGSINKGLGGTLTLRTPVATIGVRGTDFWGLQTEDSLLMALLDDGELSITFPTGTVVLSEPMTLVRYQRGQERPVMDVLTPEALSEAAATVTLPQ